MRRRTRSRTLLCSAPLQRSAAESAHRIGGAVGWSPRRSQSGPVLRSAERCCYSLPLPVLLFLAWLSCSSSCANCQRKADSPQTPKAFGSLSE
ncbi:hypothetical protein SRHO_G00318170 [Serrasalmus rhombeus]